MPEPTKPAKASTRPTPPPESLGPQPAEPIPAPDPAPAPAPEPEPSAEPPLPLPTPVAPTLPTVVTPVTLATYVGSLATFLVGVLVLCGVPIPAHVSAQVQTITGSIVSSVGAVVPLFALISHHSVQRSAISAGVPLEQVASIRG